MDPGPALAETLLHAHRTRSTGVVSSKAMVLHLAADRIRGVEGVPDLLADLNRPVSGDLARDLPRLSLSGVPDGRIADAACGGVRRALVQLIRGPGQAEWMAGGPPPPTALELPVTLLRLFTQALAEARDPDLVQRDFEPVRHAVLRVDVESARLYSLDTIARRTLAQAVGSDTLSQLIATGGRGQLNRTRHTWRAFDLLYHLGLLRLDLMQTLRSADSATQPLVLRGPEFATEPIEELDADEETDRLPREVSVCEEPTHSGLTQPGLTAPPPEPLPRPLAGRVDGAWTGSSEVIEVPLSVFDLRRMALEFTWSNPLDVVGVAPWEPAVWCNIDNALNRRRAEFASKRFEGDHDAMEGAATCLRLVEAAAAMLTDETSRRRWDEDRD